VKLTHGTARALLRMPAKDRKKAVDELVEKGELPRTKKEEKTSPKPREVAQSVVARLKKKREAHARSVVQQMANLVGLKVVEGEGEG
jgi:hypothetical protein